MNILKTKKLFTYMVVGALVMALSISCKSNEDPNSGDTKKEDQKTQERTFSYYAEDWWGDPESNGTETKFITINTDGSFIILIPSNIQVPSSNITKKSDTSYSAPLTVGGVSGELVFTFSSDTQGKCEQISGGVSASTPITKK